MSKAKLKLKLSYDEMEELKNCLSAYAHQETPNQKTFRTMEMMVWVAALRELLIKVRKVMIDVKTKYSLGLTEVHACALRIGLIHYVTLRPDSVLVYIQQKLLLQVDQALT